jgi:UDP-glucose 4-epimerase
LAAFAFAAFFGTFGTTEGGSKPSHRNLPDPISPYAVSKLAGEHYMRSFTRIYGLETVRLR